MSVVSIMFGPRHAKTCLLVYADSKGSDQPACPQSDQGHHCALTISECNRMCEWRENDRLILCACEE